MVMTNTERVSRALNLLRDGLRPECEATWDGFYGDGWLTTVNNELHNPEAQPSTNDAAFLFKGMKATWSEVFSHGFSPATRSLVFELATTRNKWAHQESFSSDDTARALDSMERLLEAFGNSEERNAIRDLRRDLMRQMIEAESRSERRKTAAKPTEGQPLSGLTPWREIITPHADVAMGRFQQAEFAANLLEVLEGKAETEYQDPKEFFARTFITEGLSDLLVGAARRLSGAGGEPVTELQTNFGGGKTHSLIALYHLASGVSPSELPGVGEALAKEKIILPTGIRRAALAGQMISVTQPKEVEKGVALHTLWGHLAYQLGGEEAYELVRADDEAGTNPGVALKTLFMDYGPAVVLIDEWVAYARQLRDGADGQRTAGGDFDTHFTFAQALTEAVAAVPNVVLLVSIPATDIEVGDKQGKLVLEKLKNVVLRTAAPWAPATTEESFEIVRRRLFDPITADKARVRDGVIRAFSEMYRDQPETFPSEAAEEAYRKRMESSYPIHPELFDRLFDDWSVLDKFQRTRGVLRLMAAAISGLCKRGDQSLLIMPGNLPIDNSALVAEMKKYLEEGWDPVIKADVDGEHSLPLRIDEQNPHFGQISATRRVARTVYMSSSPRSEGVRGVDIKSVVLGCAQPGEPARQFADALKRLSGEATHLYVDGAQYWYGLQPNVTRVAKDRAESNCNDADVDHEVRRRLGAPGDRAGFVGVHVFPDGPGDVPDEDDGVRLVVLAPTSHHISNEADTPAVKAASELLVKRSAGPRRHRNLLVFIAADSSRLSDLRREACFYLAWKSIEADAETLNLTPQQQSQARTKLAEADETVNSQIKETFVHVLTPKTEPGSADLEWSSSRLSGSGSLPQRVAKKLQSEETLIVKYSGVRVRMDLDRVPLWSEEGDLTVGSLWSAYADHPYMARLASFDVLGAAISDGTASIDWENETFAYAEAKNDETWVGVTRGANVVPNRSGLVLRPDIVPADEPPASAAQPAATAEPAVGDAALEKTRLRLQDEQGAESKAGVSRCFARFELDPIRPVRDLEKIINEVTRHLGSTVEIVLEIQAESAAGFDEKTRRNVEENARTLGAKSVGFE